MKQNPDSEPLGPEVDPKREERETVTVACAIHGGIVLRLYKEDRTAGLPQMVADGPSVRLNGPETSTLAGAGNASPSNVAPGLTEGVDAEFMQRWLEQRAGDETVKQGAVYVVQEEEEGGDPETHDGEWPNVRADDKNPTP